jgi:hypothetical protein
LLSPEPFDELDLPDSDLPESDFDEEEDDESLLDVLDVLDAAEESDVDFESLLAELVELLAPERLSVL